MFISGNDAATISGANYLMLLLVFLRINKRSCAELNYSNVYNKCVDIEIDEEKRTKKLNWLHWS